MFTSLESWNFESENSFAYKFMYKLNEEAATIS